MGLLERCEELFKTSNLYDVLGVTKEASDAEVRRGYYKVSLQVHPDRAQDDELATEKFQALGKVYEVLKDEDQRAIYDEQGIVDEESDGLNQDRNWEEYWRLLFPKITLEDILEFEKKYKDTEEEKEDLSRLYVQHEGNMDRIMDSALFAEDGEEPRLRGILQGLIDTEDLPALRAFTHESAKKKSNRKRRAEKERKEAEEMQKELGIKSTDSLEALIKRRQTSNEHGFNSLIAGLEAKYCQSGSKGSSKKKGK
ncbi:dnaJ homolog subfamily C member 9 [Clupea harengus]|uniref:DnaJ homolog subfamily C member 9 n=1 Tax=Clupea harengus TaxID=7950 RepID=A0A6P3W9X5_CLUHA|nr:dnaJ homolog subfamily C member 9 [Clupea harengus]